MKAAVFKTAVEEWERQEQVKKKKKKTQNFSTVLSCLFLDSVFAELLEISIFWSCDQADSDSLIFSVICGGVSS